MPTNGKWSNGAAPVQGNANAKNQGKSATSGGFKRGRDNMVDGTVESIPGIGKPTVKQGGHFSQGAVKPGPRQ